MNEPWFSALGSSAAKPAWRRFYGEELPHLLAVETGLTSIRPWAGACRVWTARLVLLLDAHSLENLGRECTLLDIEPGYDALMAALRAGANDRVLGTLKFPLRLTR